MPPSPAAAVALVGHLASMRNDQSRLRAAAAVIAAGGLTASGHLRLLEAAACAGTAQLIVAALSNTCSYLYLQTHSGTLLSHPLATLRTAS